MVQKTVLVFQTYKKMNIPYLFDIISKVLSTQITRNITTSLYLISNMNTSETLFSHPVIEWNKLHNNIRNSESENAFRKQILRFIKPIPNSTFNVHNPHGIKPFARFRVGLSHLRQHNLRDVIFKTL